VSVLIPARNEAAGIGACLRSVLASEGVELEVIVLDDASTDGTAEAARAVDPRVRVEPAPPLPPGWAGKQHACYTLSKLATRDTFAFLDADVRLSPDALARMAAFQRRSQATLVSGFPRQETVTVLEKLLLPLINWLLVCYLPLWLMRRMPLPSLGAGCGQCFLTTRAAYEQVGGHGHPAVRGSFHDGVKLPRAYRAAGLTTDLCDATDLATCRMYHSAGAVWRGLAKNAREGMAGPVGVWVWTLLLFGGQVLPFGLLVVAPVGGTAWWLAASAAFLNLLNRVETALWFRASGLSAVLHPFGVLLLLAVQWYAVLRGWLGRPVGWKDRPRPAGGV
jgi:glycosyltransferase involved in cell wall biosynthesis